MKCPETKELTAELSGIRIIADHQHRGLNNYGNVAGKDRHISPHGEPRIGQIVDQIAGDRLHIGLDP